MEGDVSLWMAQQQMILLSNLPTLLYTLENIDEVGCDTSSTMFGADCQSMRRIQQVR